MLSKSKVLCLFASSALATLFGTASAASAAGSNIVGLSSDGSVMLTRDFDPDNGTSKNYVVSTGTDQSVEIVAPAGTSNLIVRGLSADGKTVVGYTQGQGNGNMGFIWTVEGGFTELGQLYSGANGSSAQAVNGDGTAVVGYADTGGFSTEAFYWTATDGMIGLGNLGGSSSFAYAISKDGKTVAGQAGTAGGNSHAFSWTTSSGTMINIDTIYQSSAATQVSDDGSVLAGYGYSNNMTSGVFRWTAETGMVDIGNFGGGYSGLTAMSADGSVLVGSSTLASGTSNAFRYVASGSAGTLTNLGTLGGSYSNANDVTSDGTVVVGTSTDAGNISHGFVWNQATGMTTVEEWLTANGVNAGTDLTSTADLISGDGNVIVGQTASGSTYIARVSATDDNEGNEGNGGNEGCSPNADMCHGGGGNGGNGIIDEATYFPTVATTNNVVVQGGINSADTIMFGAQGAPMRNLLTVGQKSVWGTIDGGYDNSDNADGGLALGEFGFGYGIADGVTARFSVGGTYTDQDLDAGGDVRQRGFYLSPEVSADLGQNVYLTVGGYWGRSSVDSRRGYLNGAVTDYSSGDTNAETWGAKIRFDWLNAVTIDETAITPYVGLSYAHTKVDAFTETGGSFPVEFDGSSDHSTIARLGADFVRPLNDTVRLLAKAELDYQFENHAAATSGTLSGITDFNLEGQDLQQFWARGGIGAEFDLGKGVASFMVNATTKGQDPTVWLRSNYTVKF